jgi:hypothetical protein
MLTLLGGHAASVIEKNLLHELPRKNWINAAGQSWAGLTFFLLFLGGLPIGHSLIHLGGAHGFVGSLCQAVHVMYEQERLKLLKGTTFNVRHFASIVAYASANVRCATCNLGGGNPKESEDAQDEDEQAENCPATSTPKSTGHMSDFTWRNNLDGIADFDHVVSWFLGTLHAFTNDSPRDVNQNASGVNCLYCLGSRIKSSMALGFASAGLNRLTLS